MIRNYSEHASNERTFLSWVRTVIAIEGFGMAAARLGPTPAPVWSLVALLATGAVVILMAFLRMRRLGARISAFEAVDLRGARADAWLMALVVALFALLAIFALHVGGTR